MQPDTQDIAKAADAVRRGGVILYPTDTVWGLGCDATNADAVARVYEIKRRLDAKAMITLVADVAMLERWVYPVPDAAYDLVDTAVSPLTIIYDHPRGLAPNLVAPDGSAAVRIPLDNFCRRLCRAVLVPVVSTSANVSGEKTPRNFAEISPEIIDAADYVCLTRRDDATAQRPSAIVKIGDGGLFKIIRRP